MRHPAALSTIWLAMLLSFFCLILPTGASSADEPAALQVLRVTPAGTKTILFDFYSRVGFGEPLSAAGAQRGLAYDRSSGRLYTVDVRNNNLLVYDTRGLQFGEVFDAADGD